MDYFLAIFVTLRQFKQLANDIGCAADDGGVTGNGALVCDFDDHITQIRAGKDLAVQMNRKIVRKVHARRHLAEKEFDEIKVR